MVSRPERPPRPGSNRPSADDRRRNLRRRRRNALLVLLAGVAVIAGFVVWAGRGGDGGPDPDAAPPPVLQVVAKSPAPQLPALRTPTMSVTAAGGEGLEMRLVATPKGARVINGPWKPAAKSLAIPAAISAVLEAGSIPGYVEVRDDSGKTVRSGTLLLPPVPGTGAAEIIRSVPTSKPYVALVFDDGLDETAALRIVDILRSTTSGGTFCFNGINVKDWSASAARKIQAAVADGVIAMCNHGWTHRTSTSTTEAAAMEDLSANAAMGRFVGVSSVPFYRPPYGALSPGIEAAARRLGYRWIVLWDVDPSDYEKPDAATLIDRVVGPSGKGSIVVLHAIDTTADALPGILSGLKRRGLKAVTLTTMFSEMLAAAAAAATSTSTTGTVTTGTAAGEGT